MPIPFPPRSATKVTPLLQNSNKSWKRILKRNWLLHNSQSKNRTECLIMHIVFCSIIVNIWLVVLCKTIIISFNISASLVWSWGSSLLGRPRARPWLFILWWPWMRFRTRTGLRTRLSWFWTGLWTWSWMRPSTAWAFGAGATILFPWWPWGTMTSFAWWTGARSWTAITRGSGTWAACPKQTNSRWAFSFCVYKNRPYYCALHFSLKR